MLIPLTFAAIPIVAVCIGLAAAVLEPVCLATLALALALDLTTVCVATNASH